MCQMGNRIEPRTLHYRWILYHLIHHGSPLICTKETTSDAVNTTMGKHLKNNMDGKLESLCSTETITTFVKSTDVQ